MIITFARWYLIFENCISFLSISFVEVWNISSANPATPEAAIYSCGGVAPQSIPAAPRANQGVINEDHLVLVMK